jgi:ferredoxin
MNESRFNRYPLNVSGKYYINAQCTDCDLCRECAPNNIRRDDRSGYSYVFKQPTNPDEVSAVEKGLAGCPTDGVSNDGDQFDWDKTPIYDWNALFKKHGTDLRLDIHAPLIKEKTNRPWWKFWQVR